jgi:hypothetical protein
MLAYTYDTGYGVRLRELQYESFHCCQSCGLIFALGDTGRVELYQGAKHPSYVCGNHEQ